MLGTKFSIEQVSNYAPLALDNVFEYISQIVPLGSQSYVYNVKNPPL